MFIQLIKFSAIFESVNFFCQLSVSLKNDQIPYKSSQINYYRFGNGQKVIICFHGYGETALSFSFLEKWIENEYSLYAIDLPFHGKTAWLEKNGFTTEDLIAIIEKIVSPDRKIILLGFSLGGRVSLSLYEKIPDKIESMALLAPDGLKVNFWYWISTQTFIGNRLFIFTMKHPGWFLFFLNVIKKLGLANASVLKFVSFYINNKETRIELFHRWTSLRKLKPHLKHIKSLVRKNKTTINLVYGEYDRIILSSRGEKFRKGIEETCTLKKIPSGHRVLHERYAKEILIAIGAKPGND